ncbi:MAG TPA: hypothetical protein VN131_07135, partial [Mobilitalea sp.]|nr:hypothetical protein [Mobilitalea sp.]
MGVLTLESNKIIFQKRDEIAVLEPWGKDCLRFKSSPNARLIDEDWNLLPQEKTDVEVHMDKDKASISNGKITAVIYNSGRVVYYKNGVEILAERSEMAFHWKYREYRSLGADNHRATVIFQPDEQEHFYGLG